jgi:hypothetical protein
MSEFTSLETSKRLAVAGFEAPEGFDTAGYPFKWLERAPGDVDLVEGWHGAESGDGPIAYRADTLLSWLLSHGNSIEITNDLDGFNCTFWKDRRNIDDIIIEQCIYTETQVFLCDALAELILDVLGAKNA